MTKNTQDTNNPDYTNINDIWITPANINDTWITPTNINDAWTNNSMDK